MKLINHIKQFGIDSLTSPDLGIKVKHNLEYGLNMIDYDQIESPKSNDLVREARSLIIDTDYNVVSRSFDRFFNYGEMPETQSHIDMGKAICYEKVDGSLIKIYKYKDKWMVSTRGTVSAESSPNGFDVSFKDLVLRALSVDDVGFQKLCEDNLDPNCTMIFEVTSTENRVVKVYTGYTLYFLAKRNNFTGEYTDGTREAIAIGAVLAKSFKFGSIQECIDTAMHLKDLDEGYVLYQDGIPVCKIKSPAYVAVHHIRGDGLNPKRICQLVLTGEQDEYLNYFPEDASHIQPYVDGLGELTNTMKEVYLSAANIENQKDFALAVKDHPMSAILFQARKTGSDLDVVFRRQTESYKIKALSDFVKGQK